MKITPERGEKEGKEKKVGRSQEREGERWGG